MSFFDYTKAASFVMSHPLNSNRRLNALWKFAAWQIGSRLVPGPVVIPFVNQTRLFASPGRTSANGNLYVGLIEYMDMAFVLHALRPEDTFIDVGANVGVYSVLASGAVGCRTIAFEPAPESFRLLEENVRFNRLETRVTMFQKGVGRTAARMKFTTDRGTENRVATGQAGATVDVDITSLDEAVGDVNPGIVKIDTEGYECEVIAGASDLLSKPSVNGVMAELSGRGNDYGLDEDRVRDQLRELGFVPVYYNPESRKLFDPPLVNPHPIYVRDVGAMAERLKSAPKYRVHGRLL